MKPVNDYISAKEVDEMLKQFGDPLPPAVMQILNDTSDDRTIEDVRSELKSLARQIEAANRV